MQENLKSAVMTALTALKDEVLRHKLLYPASWVGVIGSVQAAPLQSTIAGLDIIAWQHAAIVGGVVSSLLLCVKTTLEVVKLWKEKKDESRD